MYVQHTFIYNWAELRTHNKIVYSYIDIYNNQNCCQAWSPWPFKENVSPYLLCPTFHRNILFNLFDISWIHLDLNLDQWSLSEKKYVSSYTKWLYSFLKQVHMMNYSFALEDLLKISFIPCMSSYRILCEVSNDMMTYKGWSKKCNAFLGILYFGIIVKMPFYVAVM